MAEFLSFIVAQVFSTAGIVGLLLLAALLYQTWRAERLERQRENNRIQAAKEATERGVTFLGMTDAQQQMARTMDALARSLENTQAILQRIEVALARRGRA